MQRPYRILGNFHIIKDSRENISRSKISHYGPSTKITRGENMEDMEETGAFVAATFIMKSGRQLLEQLHRNGR